MNPEDFIKDARSLLQQTGSGRPSQSSLRRALSTAYYAMFHALARNGADMLVGAKPKVRTSDSWKNVYRSLEHTRAKKVFGNSSVMGHFPPAIQKFGEVFAKMLQKRHEADYNPHARFTKTAVISDIDDAERVVADLKNASREDLRTLAVCIFFKQRTP